MKLKVKIQGHTTVHKPTGCDSGYDFLSNVSEAVQDQIEIR